MIRALALAILALTLLALWQRGSLNDARRMADSAVAAQDKALSERNRVLAVLTQERANTLAANELAARYEKEKADAQAASDRLVADLRSGTVRLHARWEAAAATAQLSATTAAAAQPDGGAADRFESAGRAIGAADQCDAQVRGLQAFALLCSGGGAK